MAASTARKNVTDDLKAQIEGDETLSALFKQTVAALGSYHNIHAVAGRSFRTDINYSSSSESINKSAILNEVFGRVKDGRETVAEALTILKNYIEVEEVSLTLQYYG